MNNFFFLFFFFLVAIGFYFLRQSREPDLLNEIYNGLRNLAFRDTQRGELTSAERYEKMAEAILEGQAYVRFKKKVFDLDHLKETSRLVLCSMDYSVLEKCGIFRQNHKHACYEAAGNLTKQLEKIIELETRMRQGQCS